MARHNDGKFKKNVLTEQAKLHAFKQGYMTKLALALLLLHDKFDFTEEQLNSFVDHSGELLDSVGDGLLTFDDIIKTLKEETGIELLFK